LLELLVVPVQRRVAAARGEVVEFGDGCLGVAAPAAAAAARRGAARDGQGQHDPAGRREPPPGLASRRLDYRWRAHHVPPDFCVNWLRDMAGAAHPLTDPKVRPAAIYRWAAMSIMAAGRMAKTASAIAAPRFDENTRM